MGDAIEVLKTLVKEKPDTEMDTESASPYEILYDDLVRHVLYGFLQSCGLSKMSSLM